MYFEPAKVKIRVFRGGKNENLGWFVLGSIHHMRYRIFKTVFNSVDCRAFSADIRNNVRIPYWSLNDFDDQFKNIAEKLATQRKDLALPPLQC